MKVEIFVFKTLMLLLSMSMCFCLNAQIDSKRISISEFQKLDKKNGNQNAILNYNNLIKSADSLLTINAFSVVNKTGVPPSGDKQDYMSIGPYWWPNPETDNGLPYIRKDGEINPETRNNYTDFVENKSFLHAIKVLSNAYYLSDKIGYGKRALELINVWFLDTDTKMNPNINFGQYIPGKNDGRCFGIIELGGLVNVLKCLELLEFKQILDDKTKKGMFNWFTEYSNWLKESKLGIEEATRENNHGTHYDVQLLSILLYLNRADDVKNHLSTVTKARIFSQIEPDGSQLKELARTKSFSYSVMNLHGFLELARLGQKVGINLWDLESKDGRSIKKGYQYMLPYLNQEKEWEYEQIEETKSSEARLIADIKYARKTFNDISFDKAIQVINNNQNIKY